MPCTRPLQLLTLIAIITVATGCQTTVGNYLGIRGRDLGECILVQVEMGSCQSGSPNLVRRKL